MSEKKSKALSLLGLALVKEGVVTEQQLERALRIQQYLEQPKQIGAILIELGYTTRQVITEVLNKHGSGMRIGDILLEQGLISENELHQALAYQKEHEMKLGAALVEMGVLNERTLLRTLAQQNSIPYIEPVFTMLERDLVLGVSPDYLDRFRFVPFSRGEDGRVTVVVSDFEDETTRQAVEELYASKVSYALGPRENIKSTIEDFRRFRQRPVQDDRGLETPGGDDAVVQIVNHLIVAAIEDRASDIHIEPMSNVVRVRYRIDGVLVYKTDLPNEMLRRLVSRIKIMADCDISDQQHHQGGRILFEHNGEEYDLRLSLYVTVHGQCTVMRILNKRVNLINLDELGMNPAMAMRYRLEVLDQPSGVVLITGPTGSGKTTTLYSSLDYCNSLERKIITAEDPVEYTIDGIIQCSIHAKIGRDFESTLREIVRQDPDIIVMGEIRDRVTAQTAIQAALTGHKVYSTFHTEDTIGGLIRLMDMNIETFLISSTVISVLAQRLPRRICDRCAAPHTPGLVEIDRLGLTAKDVHDYELRKGTGCTHCNFTGYRGRVGVYELLILNEDVRDAILQKKPASAIRHICTESTGLISMREDGIAKVMRGQTTFGEVLRHTPHTPSMRPLQQILAMTK